jgi:precorrin-6Y C5,15-methyltransferase (decarboxylating)
VEWCLAGGHATAIEQHTDRVANIRSNVDRFGLGQSLCVIEGLAPDALAGLAPPDAIFVGGGFNATLFEVLKTLAPPACKLVINAVTLETEAVLTALHAACGGELLRIELAHVAPLGRMRGWVPARPVVQWSVVL